MKKSSGGANPPPVEVDLVTEAIVRFLREDLHFGGEHVERLRERIEEVWREAH